MSARISTSVAAIALLTAGCEKSTRVMSLEQPEMAAFVELMTPRAVEIQHYLTKPVSFEGSGDADGMEVILAAKDAFGDDVKCVGTFLFEFYNLRLASGDKHGERLAYWSVTIDSKESLSQYWDKLARFYKFPLKFEGGGAPLAAGSYVLTAQLSTPTGEKLFDEYQFTHQPGAARSAR